MATYVLENIDGKLGLEGEIFLVFKNEADIVTISAEAPDHTLLLEALNDVYQASSSIRHDDTFELAGTLVGRCDGALVVPA